ncbi:ATP-binding cassette domain-containing protein [Streptomyces sp. 3MP-14]|uniref:ATP-binding cassette domain-containing protein n=1 Tax=Streptomyces mimosae TaxID=2586635 RepID=A0A5N6ALH5_9ACTN|nr:MULTISPECIES: ABC transporter ATP-binding protein [Streptomyces]KAB8168913.1 ATP-binding cassette domain-containing protein [Streptomyces mimosae]KAB8178231.1 ATP-binding cassette domain-containing protein [Streptomyces sp. 3MP-14]
MDKDALPQSGDAAADGATPLLELRDLHVYYGAIEALKGVSLTVAQGQVVALLGANGAGKSTTLKAASGMLRPRDGAVLLRGERVDGIKSHELVRFGIGHVPEGRRVFARMTILENLKMGAYRLRRPDPADLERVFTLFPVLAERRKQIAGTLSGGEQQMLAIGRALMGKPDLLLLDEPSMGLAPLIVQQIFEILREINEQGTTLLLVEQNASQALRLANYGYVLETGSVVMSNQADALLSDPRVRAAYLGEAVE